MIAPEDLQATIVEWFTGRLPGGEESPRVGWHESKALGPGTRVRKSPSVELLAAMLCRPGCMTRVSLASGQVRVEIEARAGTNSKGDGSPAVFTWAHPVESMDHITENGITVARLRDAADARAADAARRAALDPAQLAVIEQLRQAEEDLRVAKKLARAAGVIDG
jgi:hypothetical protein